MTSFIQMANGYPGTGFQWDKHNPPDHGTTRWSEECEKLICFCNCVSCRINYRIFFYRLLPMPVATPFCIRAVVFLSVSHFSTPQKVGETTQLGYGNSNSIIIYAAIIIIEWNCRLFLTFYVVNQISWANERNDGTGKNESRLKIHGIEMSFMRN